MVWKNIRSTYALTDFSSLLEGDIRAFAFHLD